jgi:predicted transcriptional regulator
MKKMKLISVRVSYDVAERLEELASVTERSQSYVASQAIEDFLTLHEWQIEAIRHGLAQADSGQVAPHSEAVKRLKRWGRRAS